MLSLLAYLPARLFVFKAMHRLGHGQACFEVVAEALSSVLGLKIEADHVMSVEKSHKQQKWMLDVMPSDSCVLTDVKVFCEKVGAVVECKWYNGN